MDNQQTPSSAPQPPAQPVPQFPAQPAATSDRDFLVLLLLSIFVGTLGIDRFYLGKIGTGILKLITFGGFGIWWIVDLILIATGKMKDKQGRPVVHKTAA